MEQIHNKKLSKYITITEIWMFYFLVAMWNDGISTRFVVNFGSSVFGQEIWDLVVTIYVHILLKWRDLNGDFES